MKQRKTSLTPDDRSRSTPSGKAGRKQRSIYQRIYRRLQRRAEERETKRDE